MVNAKHVVNIKLCSWSTAFHGESWPSPGIKRGEEEVKLSGTDVEVKRQQWCHLSIEFNRIINKCSCLYWDGSVPSVHLSDTGLRNMHISCQVNFYKSQRLREKWRAHVSGPFCAYATVTGETPADEGKLRAEEETHTCSTALSAGRTMHCNNSLCVPGGTNTVSISKLNLISYLIFHFNPL